MTEQYWVEFREATDSEVAHWAVVTRTADGFPREISAHRVEGEAAMACATANDEAARKRAAVQAAYAAGVKRAAGTGRLTQRVNGIYAAAKAAGIDVQPLPGKNAFRPR